MRVERNKGGQAKATPRGALRLVSASSEEVVQVPGRSAASRSSRRSIGYKLGMMCLVLLVGVLLGRSVILDSLTPFGLAAYAASLYMKRGASVWMGAGLLLGSFTVIAHGGNPILLFTMLIAYRVLLHYLRRSESIDIHITPFLVFAVDAGFRIGFALPTTGLTLYAAGLALIDGVLALLLALMFLQVPALLTTARPQKPLRSDEVIALTILAASVLTGLSGLSWHTYQLEAIMAGYLVIVAAASGGASLGGAVGIVTGVILALGSPSESAMIGVFGFAGVLAGILREGKRFLAGLGFLLGGAALTLYLSAPASTLTGIIDLCLSLILFYVTPESWISFVSRYIPGTTQHTVRQQDHARRIKELMTARIEDVANVFGQLATSFQDIAELPPNADGAMRQTMELTENELCRHCRKYEKCWSTDAYGTYFAMKETIEQIRIQEDMTVQEIPKDMHHRCIKLDPLLSSLKRSVQLVDRDAAVVQQLRESRGLVASQLSGVAAIMTDLAGEIRRETGTSHQQEAQILQTLYQLGLEVQGVDIISLEEGKVEIEVLQMDPTGHDECAKLVAPLLSEVLGETITVSKTDSATDGTYQLVTLTSAKLYDVQAGSACVAKDGTLQSGDSFRVIDVGNGRYALALSDGMGNGERASKESSAAVRLVEQLLKAGFDESVAIKTVNSALLLRSPEEMYATLDLAIVDLYTLQTELLKVGSVSTFVKQGRSVITVEGESVPIGILSEIDVQTERLTLHENDILVFISDGILDAVSFTKDPEEWVKRQLERFDADDPQIIADLLLEASVRAAGGVIRDDMTVLCARMTRYTPEWATIRMPNLPTLRTAKDRRKIEKKEHARRLAHV